MEDKAGHLPADHSASSPGSRAKPALAGLSMLVRNRILQPVSRHGREIASGPIVQDLHIEAVVRELLPLPLILTDSSSCSKFRP